MKPKTRKAKNRDYDPAWVYFVGGAVCLGAAILYAVFSDHAAIFMFSPRWGHYVRTPFEVYLVLIVGGLIFIALGVRKVLRSKKGPDRE
jgi:threonine/homoserine/homoserine lactone efflux protein